MKKLSLIGLCLAAALASSAQTQLVKDVERQFKANPADAQNQLTAIMPALSNPESAGDAFTWVTAAKVGIAGYDNLKKAGLLSPEGLSAGQKNIAGQDLRNGVTYLFKALPLDTVVDEKGKVKTKYSKDIVKMLRDNYQDLKQAGIWLYEAQNYPEAIEAWETYAELPNMPFMAKSGLNADPDTIVGQILAYQALAMVLDKQNERAISKVREVLSSGFSTPDVYRYGLAAAEAASDTTAIVDFAQAAYDKYGKEDSTMLFIGQLINVNLARKDYKNCEKLVSAALAANPEPTMASQLYNILGSVQEQSGDLDQAYVNFQKSTEIKDDFAKGYFDMARILYNKALKLDEEADEATRQSTINPQFREAARLFEKAYELDEDGMHQVPGILYRLYYRLEGDDSANAKKWQTM